MNNVSASSVSIVGAFFVAILTFVLGSMMVALQDERGRIDEILKLQAGVLARLEDHISDHETGEAK